MKIQGFLISLLSFSAMHGAAEPQVPPFVEMPDLPLALIGDNVQYRELGRLSSSATRFARFFELELQKRKEATELIRYWKKPITCVYRSNLVGPFAPAVINPSTALAFAPDDNLLAYAISGRIILLDFEQQMQNEIYCWAQSNQLTFSMNRSNDLHLIQQSPDIIRTWAITRTRDYAPRANSIDNRAINARVAAIAVSPDGKQTAVVYKDFRVQLFDQNGNKREIFIKDSNLPDHIRTMAMSCDGNYLAINGNGETITLVNLATKETIPLQSRMTLPDNRAVVSSIEFSPDSKLLATSFDAFNEEGGGVAVWNVATRSLCLDDSQYYAFSATFSPDGKILAYIASSQGIVLRNVETKEIINTIHTDDNHKGTVKFSPDGKCIAARLANPEILAIWRTDVFTPSTNNSDRTARRTGPTCEQQT